MKIDKNTLLTIIFTLVADIMKEPNIATQLRRPGPDPDLTDAEVITVGLYQELIGKSREDHFFRLHEHELRQYFPLLNERSRYNRRKRDLHRIFLAVRIALGMVLGTKEMKTVAIDSAPVPVVGYKRDKRQTDFTSAQYGYCSSKALKYFGYKLHSLVSLSGSVVDFCLTGAAPYDDQVVEEFLDKNEATVREVLGDKAYVSEALKKLLKEQMGIRLCSPKKSNAKTTGQQSWCYYP